MHPEDTFSPCVNTVYHWKDPWFVTELKKGKFTCNDGQCVSVEQRCNQVPDCRTGEMQILVLKNGFNRIVPPINFDGSCKCLCFETCQY